MILLRPATRARVLASTGLLLVALSGACDQTPDLTREHLRRGDAAMIEGRYARALVAYSHAREVSPADPDVQRALMRARVHLIAETPSRIAPEAIEEATYEATLLLDLDPARAPVYRTALANILLRKGDVAGARAALDEALKLDPRSAAARSALGLLLLAKQDTASQARPELEAALAADPKYQRALVGLAQLELSEGKLPSAADRLEQALALGDDFEARMALGNARAQMQRSGEALLHFQRAAQLDPKSPDALLSLGQALLNGGRADEAERALRASLSLRPDANAGLALGYALAAQRKHAQALDVFKTVLAEAPLSAPALFGAARAHEELGQPEPATALYQRILALPSGGPDKEAIAGFQREAKGRLDALAPRAPAKP